MKDNVVRQKSFEFALRIVKMHRYLAENKREYVLSKHVLRAKTSTGANVEEANQAESKPDFSHKLSIASKEASETHYRLRLLRDSATLEEKQAQSMLEDCEGLQKLLIAIIKTSKND